ncbi:MAG: hypothetical protein ACYC06_09235 [Ilumatobacteraceae bacterium]
MIKRFALVCVLGGLLLSACSSSNDSTSTTSNGSVVVLPGTEIKITDEQAKTLIGKTETIAEAYAHDNGWVWRIGERDGHPFGVTMDYCDCRVTVSIDNGIVIGAVVG